MYMYELLIKSTKLTKDVFSLNWQVDINKYSYDNLTMSTKYIIKSLYIRHSLTFEKRNK